MVTSTLPKINIGAGKKPLRGWINADLYAGPGIDGTFDACKTWPFEDSSIGQIFGNHVLEHLPDPMTFFREAHRVLIHGGRLELTMPYGISNEAIADPTHLKSWIPASFCFLQPGWDEECHNPQHDAWKATFVIQTCMRQVHTSLRWLMKKPLRHLGIRILPFLHNAYCGLFVALVAVKDEAQARAWRKAGNYPQQVIVRDFMYRHDYQGRSLRKDEKKEIVFFAEHGEF